tara:strand:+ start:11348 stop:11461 length:114 start_codon:yes stop_codon:yes gene_type:complete
MEEKDRNSFTKGKNLLASIMSKYFNKVMNQGFRKEFR